MALLGSLLLRITDALVSLALLAVACPFSWRPEVPFLAKTVSTCRALGRLARAPTVLALEAMMLPQRSWATGTTSKHTWRNSSLGERRRDSNGVGRVRCCLPIPSDGETRRPALTV